MSDGGWEEIAEWYDAKMGDEGDLWHRYLIDPGLLAVVGSVRGLRVLDLACGNGYLARRFAREGAATVVGVDASAPIVALARGRETSRSPAVRYEVRDTARLAGFGDSSFDLVVSNMAMMDIADASSTAREVGRVTRTGGRFVFSISHPCFDINERSMWVVERIAFQNVVWRKVSGYRREEEQPGAWILGPGRFHFTKSYHRTLATYARYLRDAGFAITRLEEPSPQPKMVVESPQGPWIEEIPLHLVVEAVRLGATAGRPERASRPRAHPVRRPGSRTSARTPRRGGRRSGSHDRTRGIGSARRGSSPGS